MSFTAIRPYFRDKLDALNYEEWPDAFNTENIPSNVLDNAYHVFMPTIIGAGLNQDAQEIQASVEVRIFRKGFSEPAAAMDEFIGDLQTFVESCVATADRLTHPIKNVVFEDLELAQLDESNDNAIIGLLNFTVRVILDV